MPKTQRPRRAAAVAAAASFVAAAAAQPVHIDFDTDANGNALVAGSGFDGSTVYSGVGVIISVDSPRNSPLNLFDTQNPTGGDQDLATGPAFGTEPLGNVLIIQELRNNPISTPDDDAAGGTVTFEFTRDEGAELLEIALLDLDENVDPVFTIESVAGQTTVLDRPAAALVNPSHPDDNSLRTFDLTQLDPARSISIQFPGVSGAIASLSYAHAGDVPTPGSAALMLTGAALVTRRRGGRRTERDPLARSAARGTPASKHTAREVNGTRS